MSLRELEDIVIYRDAHWYSAFPSLVAPGDGRAMVVYYASLDDGTRHIAGIFVSVA
jgi:hypothetical protein